MNSWSTEDVTKLKDCYSAGYSSKYIAAKLQRVPKSVDNKLHRLRQANVIATRDYTPTTINNNLEEAVTTEKEQLLQRTQTNLLKAAIRKQAATEVLIDAVTAATYKIPAVKPTEVRPIKTTFEDEVATLVISDCHLGEELLKEETGGLAEYGTQKFLLQLENLKKAVTNITAIHRRAYNMPKLNVLFLGDMVSNELIYEGQQGYVDNNVVDQMMMGTNKFSEFLIFCNRLYPKVNVTCLFGNHGRVSQKSVLKPHVNWDYMLYHYMKATLANYTGITFTIPKAWWHLKEINGWKFLLQHGEDIKGYMNLPYYAYERLESRWLRLLREIGESFTYCIVAHQHTAANIGSGSGERIVNGAWTPGSMLSLKKMWVASKPRQLFFGVSKKQGITWRYWVNL